MLYDTFRLDGSTVVFVAIYGKKTTNSIAILDSEEG